LWAFRQNLSERPLIIAARTSRSFSAPERLQRIPGSVRRALNCLAALSLNHDRLPASPGSSCVAGCGENTLLFHQLFSDGRLVLSRWSQHLGNPGRVPLKLLHQTHTLLSLDWTGSSFPVPGHGTGQPSSRIWIMLPFMATPIRLACLMSKSLMNDGLSDMGPVHTKRRMYTVHPALVASNDLCGENQPMSAADLTWLQGYFQPCTKACLANSHSSSWVSSLPSETAQLLSTWLARRMPTITVDTAGWLRQNFRARAASAGRSSVRRLSVSARARRPLSAFQG